MAKKSIRVEIDEGLHTRAKMKSAVTGKTLADVCREAIQRWVDEEFPIILPRSTNKSTDPIDHQSYITYEEKQNKHEPSA